MLEAALQAAVHSCHARGARQQAAGEMYSANASDVPALKQKPKAHKPGLLWRLKAQSSSKQAPERGGWEVDQRSNPTSARR